MSLGTVLEMWSINHIILVKFRYYGVFLSLINIWDMKEKKFQINSTYENNLWLLLLHNSNKHSQVYVVL